MTPPKEKPEARALRLATEHWNWLEGILLEEMRMKMRLFNDAFTHGYRHGRKDEKEESGVRTKPTKKP